jgi:hypothetical protein
VGAGAEGEVSVDVGPPEVELVWTIEALRIPVRRADADEDVGAFGQFSVAVAVARRRQCTTDES